MQGSGGYILVIGSLVRVRGSRSLLMVMAWLVRSYCKNRPLTRIEIPHLGDSSPGAGAVVLDQGEPASATGG
jgi:hypothetical protein